MALSVWSAHSGAGNAPGRGTHQVACGVVARQQRGDPMPKLMDQCSSLSRRVRVGSTVGIVVILLLGAAGIVFWRLPVNRGIAWFPAVNERALTATWSIDFIPGLQAYQQTTDYTAGPAILLTVARFYKVTGVVDDAAVEQRIAREAGTRDLTAARPGTRPEEMVNWLRAHGLAAELTFEAQGDGSALRKLHENIRQGIPTIVEWIDIGGTWAIAAGFDDRGTSDPWDDVLILADPYDRYDDHRDGYTVVNANRFYWMWFDALYFDQLTWRTMITVTRP